MKVFTDAQIALISWLGNFGLNHFQSGKTRDIFHLPGHPDFLLFIASDRISIFDIILNVLIPGKGAVLTAMTVEWATRMSPIVSTHLVAYGSQIDAYLPRELRGNSDLQRRALVVRKSKVYMLEMIVRGYLTGSGLDDYVSSGGFVCGQKLEPGLHDGSMLNTPIISPSTKAEYGAHDKNIDFADAKRIVGAEAFAEMAARTMQMYMFMADHARRRGYIIADMKTEHAPGRLVDEFGTPDCMRLWRVSDWIEAQKQGKSPQGLDKQFMREWGKSVDIKNYPDRVPPFEVVKKTASLYEEAFDGLFGDSVHDFWINKGGVAA